MKDQINTGARRVQRCLAPDRMRNRLTPETVRFAHNDVGFLLREGGDQFAVGPALDSVERDLDAIDAVLDLPSDLLHRLVDIRDELADRGLGRADPGRIPVGQALMRRDVRARGHDPRAVEQPGAHRIADRQRDLSGIARRADRGVPGSGDLLGEKHAAQRAEFKRSVKVDVLLALGIAVSEMRVHVDQPRHHKPARMVDRPVAHAAGRRGLLGADEGKPATFVEHQNLVPPRLVLGAGKQSAAPHKGFHCRLLTAPDTRSDGN